MLYYPDYFDEAEYIMKARGFAHPLYFHEAVAQKL